ncbi:MULTISPECIES: TetR/AcrR family transcriptional regulator C-terminal domain-containing protein [unclassified Parafrankia]|uniref:TetR/AcrR family transcriptional regulator C-terminal domain-containing protein n=1 Tax=unclassified Parafrankia TaxID=2994368 RepID=UPI000DA54FFB|nr:MULTISPECIES: TetR/AcrR family transcriptional regulator C-terminal domain-containing protein [unclassified Parafrankia]SQE00233.1 Transcriptional regulator, TetR family [Parafrankia sp. Ea1.12]
MKISALGNTGPERRTQLTRERVMAAAVELADRDGIESISMRKLAQELGVEAMSLYTHVRNKNDLLDGMADAVISQIPTSADGVDWKTSLRQMALAARSVVQRHPWAPRTVQAQTTPGPAVLQYVNAVIGTLREGGFSIAQAHHALHILGSRLLGFTQDLFDDSGDLEPEAAASLASDLGASHPYVVEMALAVTHGGTLGRCDDDAEFEFALDFILDGLARLQSD